MNFLLINKVERGISDILRGMPIILKFQEKYYFVFSAELFEEDVYEKLTNRRINKYNVIITNNRAKSIGIKTNNLLCNFDEIKEILIIKKQKKEYLSNDNYPTINHVNNIAIDLMKITNLLPIAIIEETIKNKDSIDIKEIEEYLKIKKETISRVSQSKIVLKNAKNAEIIVFRDLPFFGKTHLAIIIGKQNINKPLIRIHSGCYTGDLLSSLQCDCRDQLQYTISYMNQEYKKNNQYGILIYQAIDEGRAIGLANKIRAYNLQNNGCNTIEANHAIGFEEDERNFLSSVNILLDLNIHQCDLMTNNPEKISFLKQNNIQVENIIPVITQPNCYNKKYLNTKFSQMNHLLAIDSKIL